MSDVEVAQINARIRWLVHDIEQRTQELADLYERRCGRVLFDGDKVQQAWCKECGQQAIDLNAGEDTCDSCQEAREHNWYG